jgi:hypothetical protein
MAKTYGISDRKTGSIGGLTYSMTKDGIIVKEKIVKNKSHTKSQVIQRCFFSSVVKAGSFFTPEFLEKCFENKKRTVSYSNAFANKNRKNGTILAKDYAKDPNIIALGNWQLSEGSLITGLNLTKTVKDDTTPYIGIPISKTELPVNGTATVAQVSTNLLAAYPELKEDMAINMIAVDNIGVTGSEDSGGVGYIGTHYVETIKQNFMINTNDNTVIVKKGFKVVKSNDGDYGLLILKEGSTTEICPDMKYEQDNLELNVAFAGLVITKTVGTKVYVQTSYVVGNWGYENGITILKNDLAGDQINLNTYDIEEEAMIVDDTQI